MNVGDYVRTPQGIIAKIINIQEDTGQYFLNGNAVSLESKNYIADKNITIGENFKHSPNITDLIEEHDILKIEEQKGIYTICEVEVFREPYTKYDFLGVRLDNRPIARKLYELNIISIVTKEQFESMEYKVGD